MTATWHARCTMNTECRKYHFNLRFTCDFIGRYGNLSEPFDLIKILSQFLVAVVVAISNQMCHNQSNAASIWACAHVCMHIDIYGQVYLAFGAFFADKSGR